MVKLEVRHDLNNMKSTGNFFKLKSIAMVTEFNSIKIINKKHTWNYSKRPEEHLCKKQSIIYIKHTSIICLLKSFKKSLILTQNFNRIEH